MHLRLEIPPKYAISEVVQKLKAYTSAHLKRKFKFIGNIYANKGNMWGVGYFILTVGLNENQIKKYIERQNKYDTGLDITDEFS